VRTRISISSATQPLFNYKRQRDLPIHSDWRGRFSGWYYSRFENVEEPPLMNPGLSAGIGNPASRLTRRNRP